MSLGADWTSEFHKRAGESHAEARRLLTGMAVGSLGVLYATLTGKDAPVLDSYSRSLAVAAVVSMALAAGFGLAAWRADAAWAYDVTKHPNVIPPYQGAWHHVKKWSDRIQFTFFGVGLSVAFFLILRLL